MQHTDCTVHSTRYRLRTVDAKHTVSYVHSNDYSYLHQHALRVASRGGRASFEKLTERGYVAF